MKQQSLYKLPEGTPALAMSKKERLKDNHRQFLLSFFDDSHGYKEVQVNGFWLVRSFNPKTQKHQVALYTDDAFKSYKTS